MSLVILSAGIAAYFLFPQQHIILIWTCLFGFLLGLSRQGETKLQQVYSILYSALLTLVMLTITAFISLIKAPYLYFMLSCFFFILLCLHRYLPGGRIQGVFQIIYMILFNYLFPHIGIQHFSSSLIAISISLGLVILFTIVFICSLPKISIPIPQPNKSNYVIKQAFRTTVLLNIAFLLGHMIDIRNVAWICFSILVICEDDFHTSFKKSIERAIGTIVGAGIGIVGAHTLFAINPHLTLIICLIIFFLTFLTIKTSYTLGICLATILVSASFYLYHLPITFDQFALSRIVDTLIGISLALAGEYFIFPNKKR